MYTKADMVNMYNYFQNILLLLALLFVAPHLGFSTNITEYYASVNPVKPADQLSMEESIALHKKFLEKVEQGKNEFDKIVGNIFLFHDFRRIPDFETAQQYLLAAESLANASKNPQWIGWVLNQKGIFYIVQRNFLEAKAFFGQSIPYLEAAKDSAILAESIEQLGAASANLGDFEAADNYFNQAFRMLEAQKDELGLAVAMNNYGILLRNKEDYKGAIGYYTKAIEKFKKIDKISERTSHTMNNLGDAYFNLGLFQKALDVFNECESINKENKYTKLLLSTYQNLYEVYKAMGDSKRSLNYLESQVALRDSMMAIDQKLVLAKKEADFQKMELSLQNKNLELQYSKSKVRYLVFSLISAFLAFLVGAWAYGIKKKEQRYKEKLEQNESHLKSLTKILATKNEKILSLESNNLAFDNNSEDHDFFNMRILTPEDWMEFKRLFDETYPGFILKLRKKFPDLTEAEERNFLLIKLSLDKKEIANILGISMDGVKKSRSRLKRKLLLPTEVNLDEFIKEF